MSRVGLNPLQSVVNPSFLAILRKPSRVELNVRRCVSSATHSDISISFTATEAVGSEATQNWLLLGTQKTSRQQAVMPVLEGRWANDVDVVIVE